MVVASRRTMLAGMATTTIAACAPLPVGRSGSAALKARSANGIQFGAAVRPEQLVSKGRLAAAAQQCDILVPEYHGQWSAVEWRKGKPWFGNYDCITEWAELHGQTVRGHSLIWDQMTPDWAREQMLESSDWRPVERHFDHLLSRYRGRIAEWVVVNEMIDTEDGEANLRRTTFQRAFGNTYVERALHQARSHDPEAILMINDFALCHDNPVDERRRSALLRLVEQLKRANVPLDAVGIQGHLELAKGPLPQKRLARFFQQLADMGVTLAITEMDVLESDRTDTLAQRDKNIAEMINSLLEVVCDQPKMTSVTTWGLSDRDSWLQDKNAAAEVNFSPDSAAALNRGLPYDWQMKPKKLHATLGRHIHASRMAAG